MRLFSLFFLSFFMLDLILFSDLFPSPNGFVIECSIAQETKHLCLSEVPLKVFQSRFYIMQ